MGSRNSYQRSAFGYRLRYAGLRASEAVVALALRARLTPVRSAETSLGAAGTSTCATSWGGDHSRLVAAIPRIALLAALSLGGCLLAAPAVQAETILIRNATVLTVTKGTIENGSVLMQDGKVAAVGKNLSAPAGATVVDGTGKFVSPGLIDCHSHTAVEGSVNEGSVSDSSMVNIADVLDPMDINIYRALAGGLTVSNVLHGSANAIGGQTIMIKLRWGKPAKDLIFEGAKPGIKFALGENPKRQGYPPDFFSATTQERRFPGTRLGVEDEIREDFTQAKIYQAKWKEYNEHVARGEHPIPPRRDLRLEPLVEVLEGKRYVHAHSYRADEILALIRTADDMGFKIRTFQHVLEGYKVADEIAAHGAGASTFSDWYGYKYEVIDATPYNAAIMARKGIVVSLNSDSDELQRHLNWDAAKVIRYGGLTPDEALAMVTINPAKQLGIDDKVGSIEAGKSADLVLYDKHPLSNYAKVLAVWIDGHQYFDRDQDLKDREKLAARKKELVEKEKAAEEAARKRNAADEKSEGKPQEGRKPPAGDAPPKDGVTPKEGAKPIDPQIVADQAKEGAL